VKEALWFDGQGVYSAIVIMANNNKRNVRYVYHLPYFERRELCRILDRMDKWEELGKKPCAVLLLPVACYGVVKENKFNETVNRKQLSG
jgi:hypothetical protein